jgi:hypothetical protein
LYYIIYVVFLSNLGWYLTVSIRTYDIEKSIRLGMGISVYLLGGALLQKGFVVSVINLFLVSKPIQFIRYKKLNVFDIVRHDPTPKIEVIVSVAYTSRYISKIKK